MGKPQSYHILKQLGKEVYMPWWPMCAWGIYCLDEKAAVKQFRKTIKDDPKGLYRLLRYEAVIGPTGNCLGVIKESVSVMFTHP